MTGDMPNEETPIYTKLTDETQNNESDPQSEFLTQWSEEGTNALFNAVQNDIKRERARLVLLIVIAIGIVLALVFGTVFGAVKIATASGDTVVCTSTNTSQCLFTGSANPSKSMVDIQPASGDIQALQNQLVLSDHLGTPTCWGNVGGNGPNSGGWECASASQSPGDAPIKVGTNVFNYTAAMQDNGTIVLQPCGSSSCAVTLTATDVSYMHSLENAHVSVRELAHMLAAWKANGGKL